MANWSIIKFRFLIISLVFASAWSVWGQENEDDTVGELQCKHGRSVCIYFLDGYLCLSPEQSNALDEALKEFQKAVDHKPKYPQAQTNLAKALLELGQTDKALVHFYRALKQ